MSADYLKPCPFCGKNETIIKEESGVWYVSCFYCGGKVYGPPTGEKEDAVEFWNDRPQEAELLEILKKIKKSAWDLPMGSTIYKLTEAAIASLSFTTK